MNLPDGVAIMDLPECSPEDERLENAVEEMVEEIKETIRQYQQEYPLTDYEISAILEEIKPSVPRRVVND